MSSWLFPQIVVLFVDVLVMRAYDLGFVYGLLSFGSSHSSP